MAQPLDPQMIRYAGAVMAKMTMKTVWPTLANNLPNITRIAIIIPEPAKNAIRMLLLTGLHRKTLPTATIPPKYGHQEHPIVMTAMDTP